ncbi:hypothetical protein, conserved [Leishmania tarentolae]|uniref:Uncharacterized protein n=1 Tax=Leishmania tarentolae TaxID=5689 RepID=A0A640KUU4_LEITA|nr:hypothetical protein, conserved [Leishmania tarentolae]
MDDSCGSALFPQPSTPELQRFQFQKLRCYPETQTPTVHHDGAVPYAEEVVSYMYADEEDPLHARHANEGNATLPQPLDDCANPCTPRTVCQPRTRQCAEIGSLHPFSDSLCNAHVSATLLQQSPCSFMPSIADAPVVRRARSLSYPSADRSVAPARCSVGYGTGIGGAGQSIGRCTTVFSGVPSAGVNMCSTASAFAAARPTVSLHSALPTAALSIPNEHWHTLQERHSGAGDLPACGGNDVSLTHTCNTHMCTTSASVPRLTRLSLSSNGHSPAVPTNWSIGRPTTLRCRDTEFDVHSDWGAIHGGEESGKEQLINCATQVWRESSEVQMLLQRSHDAEEKGDELLLDLPTLHCDDNLTDNRDLFASSPPITWQPAAPPASVSGFELDRSGSGQDNAVLLSGAPVVSIDEDTHTDNYEVARVCTIPTRKEVAATESSDSFDGLEAAPRKGYARSKCGTPPPSHLGLLNNAANPRTYGRTDNGVSEGVKVSFHAAALEANSHHFGGPLCATFGSGCSDPSRPSAEWRDYKCTATPQGRGVWGEVPGKLRDAEYSVSTMTAGAVAARLDHISLHTSPTPKRLAFEEEDFAERESGGGSPTLVPAVYTAGDGSARQRASDDASAAEVGFLGRDTGSRGSSGMRWASAFSNNGDRNSCRSRVPSGLQLLRSRKRCLAEMQSRCTQERHANNLVSKEMNHTHDANYSAPNRAGSMGRATPFEKLEEEDGDGDEDAVKRQRREEQRRTRLPHLFLASTNTTDDLIPAPVRSVGRGLASCSSVPSSNVRSALNGIQSALEQQQQDRPRNDYTASWSQMSSISYVTPASQSTSMGFWGLPTTLSQGHHGGAVVCSVGSGSQVLTPLPTNSTAQTSRKP